MDHRRLRSFRTSTRQYREQEFWNGGHEEIGVIVINDEGVFFFRYLEIMKDLAQCWQKSCLLS